MSETRRSLIGLISGGVLLVGAACVTRVRRSAADSAESNTPHTRSARQRDSKPGGGAGSPLQAFVRGAVTTVAVGLVAPTLIAAVSIPLVVHGAHAAESQAASADPPSSTAHAPAEPEPTPDPVHDADWAAAQRGLEQLSEEQSLAVVVADLDTDDRLLDFNGDAVSASASVYKLHTMYSILSHIEAGELSADSLIGGLPAYDCVEASIVYSENDCAQAWIAEIGFDAHQAAAVEAGATQTTNEPYDMRSSPNDFAAYLSRLLQGELLNEHHTELLLEQMSSQVWRDGIPAAATAVIGSDVIVADKPGWLEGVRNDAAIVTVNDRHFAVVIFTGADDWEFVATAAAEVLPLLSVDAEALTEQPTKEAR